MKTQSTAPTALDTRRAPLFERRVGRRATQGLISSDCEARDETRTVSPGG
jgi:hypothetical protein